MKRKALFIDRDGTIIVEPVEDMQVDSLEKLEFVPGAISALRSLAALDYDMVLASNQDGLGTASFPEETFWPAHRKMLKTLAGEGVIFSDELIDRSMPEDNAPTRKPRTGMFCRYMDGSYDLASSYVIGDRATDVELAYNLGARAVLLQRPEDGERMLAGKPCALSCVLMTDSWADVAEFLRRTERRAVVTRRTSETDIRVEVDLDGKGESRIDTGLKFFDHMLDQIPHHSGMSLSVACRRADRDVQPLFQVVVCSDALQPSRAGPRREQPPHDRRGVQGLRPRPEDGCAARCLQQRTAFEQGGAVRAYAWIDMR